MRRIGRISVCGIISLALFVMPVIGLLGSNEDNANVTKNPFASIGGYTAVLDSQDHLHLACGMVRC